ncbi:sulfur carrier protein ThiS adenylyltransferase ThiF [[Clostridium] fimetarium]|uniref:Sulfur carrier protein ThiS adenylyltransferase n=1 Tax=[Clostridium] fimetarium TaxID=99656 RepID=A0A1I0R788_9FIRM|nr:sulfur carrier protein ThiS adenylyltransferase ThiF [[Clostridium] fimetarium]SEW36516.1 sulfur carrier protein ThiS adenylyltransferase [[Clostridium] fimetarium]
MPSKKEESIPSEKEFEKIMDKRFSSEIYEKLKCAEIAISGLGGLGSNIAIMLARTGIGHLHLVDFDMVDISNLNRQVYLIQHIGMRKTDALKIIISEINPYIKITTDHVYITQDNVKSVFSGYSIICEAFDKPENKAMLINELSRSCPVARIVSGSGMAGYGSSNTIMTKKVFKNLYLCGDRVTDIENGIGLMSPRVSICAGHQANMVVRLILGLEEE